MKQEFRSLDEYLYCDTFTKTLITKAIAIVRSNAQKTVIRDVEKLEEGRNSICTDRSIKDLYVQ